MTAHETHRNPRTGHAWTFPKDARRYLGIMAAQKGSYRNRGDLPACENGHFACALWEGGPCEARIHAEYVYEAEPVLPPTPAPERPLTELEAAAQHLADEALMSGGPDLRPLALRVLAALERSK